MCAVVVACATACGGGGGGPTAPIELAGRAVAEPMPAVPDGPIGARLTSADEGCVAAGAVLDLAFQHLALGARGADPAVMADVAAQADAFRPKMSDVLRRAVEEVEVVLAESAAALSELQRQARADGLVPDVLDQQAIFQQVETDTEALPLNDLLAVSCGFG